MSEKGQDGYYCRECGDYTHKSNSHYVEGWARARLCPECVRSSKEWWQLLKK